VVADSVAVAQSPSLTEHFVARLADLPLNKIHRIEIESRVIGIIRTDQGVFAIGNKCPHQGGPMCSGHITGTMLASDADEYVYGHDGMVVQCPWHAYEFRIDTGKSVGGVINGRVPVFYTAVRDGNVYCSLKRLTPGGSR
jgi:nitrite reductase (NADH) small subunit